MIIHSVAQFTWPLRISKGWFWRNAPHCGDLFQLSTWGNQVILKRWDLRWHHHFISAVFWRVGPCGITALLLIPQNKISASLDPLQLLLKILDILNNGLLFLPGRLLTLRTLKPHLILRWNSWGTIMQARAIPCADRRLVCHLDLISFIFIAIN